MPDWPPRPPAALDAAPTTGGGGARTSWWCGVCWAAVAAVVLRYCRAHVPSPPSQRGAPRSTVGGVLLVCERV